MDNITVRRNFGNREKSSRKDVFVNGLLLRNTPKSRDVSDARYLNDKHHLGSLNNTLVVDIVVECVLLLWQHTHSRRHIETAQAQVCSWNAHLVSGSLLPRKSLSWPLVSILAGVKR